MARNDYLTYQPATQELSEASVISQLLKNPNPGQFFETLAQREKEKQIRLANEVAERGQRAAEEIASLPLTAEDGQPITIEDRLPDLQNIYLKHGQVEEAMTVADKLRAQRQADKNDLLNAYKIRAEIPGSNAMISDLYGQDVASKVQGYNVPPQKTKWDTMKLEDGSLVRVDPQSGRVETLREGSPRAEKMAVFINPDTRKPESHPREDAAQLLAAGFVPAGDGLDPFDVQAARGMLPPQSGGSSGVVPAGFLEKISSKFFTPNYAEINSPASQQAPNSPQAGGQITRLPGETPQQFLARIKGQ